MFYIVATPVGNLSDLSFRALEVLKSVDAILCEDTRVTAKLLAHFEMKKPLIAYHQHSSDAVTARVLGLLGEGKSLALVSDAGTPGINDPGGRLVAEVVGHMPSVVVCPIPGANAGVTALSASGFSADRYQYWGFVPNKKGRQTFFRELADCSDTIVFYESKHRIAKALTSLVEVVPDRPIMVARELTKKFETLYRGTPSEVASRLTGDNLLGEFVVVVSSR